MSKATVKVLAAGVATLLLVLLLYPSGPQQQDGNTQQIFTQQQQSGIKMSFQQEPPQQRPQQDTNTRKLFYAETTGSKVALWTHDLVAWRQNTTLCDRPVVDTPSVLRTPAGPVAMSVYDPTKDIWVSRKIIRTGDFDGNKRQLVFSILERSPDVNFIDVGCNIGVYTLTMAKMGRQVLCIDALYLNVEHVCSSVVQNNFQNSITIVMNALSNSKGSVQLGVDSKNYGGTFVDEDAGEIKRRKGGTVTGDHYTSITSVIMDDLLQLPVIQNFKKPFIKMDIEGFEWKALERAELLFKALDVQGVFMEWIFHTGKESGVKITDFMIRHNLYPHAQLTPTTYKPLDVSQRGKWNFMDILWLKK